MEVRLSIRTTRGLLIRPDQHTVHEIADAAELAALIERQTAPLRRPGGEIAIRVAAAPENVARIEEMLLSLYPLGPLAEA